MVNLMKTKKDMAMFVLFYFLSVIKLILGQCNETSVTTVSVLTTVSEHASAINPVTVTVTVPIASYLHHTVVTDSLASPTVVVITATETDTIGDGISSGSTSVVDSSEVPSTITRTKSVTTTQAPEGVPVSVNGSSSIVQSVTGNNTVASLSSDLTLTFPIVTATSNTCTTRASTTVPGPQDGFRSVPGMSVISYNLSTIVIVTSTAAKISFSFHAPTGIFSSLVSPILLATTDALGSAFNESTITTTTKSVQPIESVLSGASSLLNNATSIIAGQTSMTTTSTVTSSSGVHSIHSVISATSSAVTVTRSTILTVTTTITFLPVESVYNVVSTTFAGHTSTTTMTVTAGVHSIESVLSTASFALANVTAILSTKTITRTVSESLHLAFTEASIPTSPDMPTTTTLTSYSDTPISQSIINRFNISATTPVTAKASEESSTSVAQVTRSATTSTNPSISPSVYAGSASSLRVPRGFSMFTRILMLLDFANTNAKVSATGPSPSASASRCPCGSANSTTRVSANSTISLTTTTRTTTTVTATTTSHTTVPTVVNGSMVATGFSNSTTVALNSTTTSIFLFNMTTNGSLTANITGTLTITATGFPSSRTVTHTTHTTTPPATLPTLVPSGNAAFMPAHHLALSTVVAVFALGAGILVAL